MAISQIFSVLLFGVVGVKGSEPIKTYGPFDGYELGYISLRKYEGMRLNVTHFATINVTKPLECAEECMMATPVKCNGFNIGKTNESDVNSTEVVGCHLLEIDRYRLPPYRFINDSNLNYYEPSVSVYAK